MIVIIMAVILSTLIGILSDICYSKARSLSDFLFIIAAFVLLMPVALRGMGIDYNQYFTLYGRITLTDPATYWSTYQGMPEPLYVVLNFVARAVFGSFQGVNVLCALLSIVPWYWTINYFRNKVSVSIVNFSFGFSYYMYLYGLNRMMIAVSIVSCAYVAYIERKPKTYFMIIMIASLFHYSAIIMFPMYFALRWIERTSIIKGAKAIKYIMALALITGGILYVFPRLAGSFVWFGRYKEYFVSNANFSAINNSAPFFLAFLCLIVCPATLTKYLDDNGTLVSLGWMLILLTLFGAVYGMHRLCIHLFPAGVLIYGAVPRALAAEGAAQSSRSASMLMVLLLVAFGIVWMARPYYTVDTLWMPYLDPYRLGVL